MAAGAVLGLVLDAGAVEHRVQVPPGVGGTVESIVPAGSYPANRMLASVGGTPVSMSSQWPVRLARPYRNRRDDAAPLNTGQRVVDQLFPIARGSTAAVPGGFGTGKTVLLQQLAKWCDADVIVYVGCGERGNEMAEVVADMLDLTDPRTDGRLAERTVIIANTSNMPMMAREASIYTGVTVGEYFRDMDHVVVIADSTSRWAEALREFASAAATPRRYRGYPVVALGVAAFYEMVNFVMLVVTWSVTVVGAVSPPRAATCRSPSTRCTPSGSSILHLNLALPAGNLAALHPRAITLPCQGRGRFPGMQKSWARPTSQPATSIGRPVGAARPGLLND